MHTLCQLKRLCSFRALVPASFLPDRQALVPERPATSALGEKPGRCFSRAVGLTPSCDCLPRFLGPSLPKSVTTVPALGSTGRAWETETFNKQEARGHRGALVLRRAHRPLLGSVLPFYPLTLRGTGWWETGKGAIFGQRGSSQTLQRNPV